MPDAAWKTAHETGALALFPTDDVQGYSMLYGQQSLVNAAGIDLSHDFTNASIPLRVEPDLKQLNPALIDELIRACATSLNQIDYIEDLAKSLDENYHSALSQL
jgi:hypothetical protein